MKALDRVEKKLFNSSIMKANDRNNQMRWWWLNG